MSKKQYRRFAGNAYNLVPYQFQYLPEELHKKISRKGGLASGRRRLELAEARDLFVDSLISYALRDETRAHFREAIRRYAAQELRKRKRRKATNE